MKIKSAEFVMSNSKVEQCPAADMPEYAFIGRSNVGKSSLVNMLTERKALAKTSGTPGKTQLINHFIINDEWYLVDLPGYGYAKVSKKSRKVFSSLITDYLSSRTSLVNVFVLIDCRHKPQQVDLDFLQWLGENQIPFSIVFTKIDKLSSGAYSKNMMHYKRKLLETWDSIPKVFATSSASKTGRNELLDYIDKLNEMVEDHFKKKF